MRKPDYTRRVVVTGLGIVSPIGNDMDTVWENLVSGRSGIGEITHFDTTPYEHKAGGEVHDFDVTKFWNFKDARRTDTTVHFAVASAKMAVADSGLEINDDNRYDIGVIYGSGGGGQASSSRTRRSGTPGAFEAVSPFFIANGLVDASSGTIAIETGAKGHNFCPVSACSTGTTAIGEAAEAIRRGDCTAVIAGSAESPLLELVHIGFTNMRGLGTPLPGRADRDGLPPVRPDPRRLRPRRGRWRADPRGPRACQGPRGHDLRRGRGLRLSRRRLRHDRSGRRRRGLGPGHEDGPGAARRAGRRDRHDQPARHLHPARRQARERGDLGRIREPHAEHPDLRDQIDDRSHDGRRRRLRRVATVLSIYHQTVPATLNYREPDPECNINVATETIEKPLRYAMSNNIGLGGHNAAVIFKRYTGD